MKYGYCFPEKGARSLIVESEGLKRGERIGLGRYRDLDAETAGLTVVVDRQTGWLQLLPKNKKKSLQSNLDK